ncbi:energy-coupling factor ABC transporter ATP-binding protein [Dolosicoccus paucivorans]|uniref:Energy-coupling factor ABC transporter ATP-binding protein n=1 Tax=Dolosicoccus paucivorans TaxID=84521 RepID=A0A1G8IJ08_9LACT|nr:energy-coupling factor ABC transporter ATP-binding protein [Dolosicoccus paucivorans]PMB84956.1 energy-coupling factor ABC transporter ATP-binding protein [Dolosicoccus paucivorans]PMC58727.1 energy-coupling factor ABC transporter ATP-binding protein [Dolosicoccus paucivorans]SDI18767.1 energy-coupling factor transport system ATP-binding protein [Dolosicoccus paucivorans]
MKRPIIELKNIQFKYYETKQNVLNNISLDIYPQEWVAVIGHNGSGKSTMAKIMNGLLIPDEGSVAVNGVTLNEETVWQARQSIGLVFQNPDNQFVGATVEDDVAFGLENNGIEPLEMAKRVNEALEEVRMSAFKQAEPARLSGGQKQRVALASVIALRPDVIILDEATAMLDPLGRKEVIETIYELKERFNLTVISITHDLDEAALADRIVVMSKGEVVREGTPEEIFSLGDELVNIGLDVPFSMKLKKELASYGLNVPEGYLTREELLEWLISSHLTM